MKDNRLQARDLGRFSTISALLLLMFLSEVECALSWNDYSDVLSGQIIVYTGPNLVNPATSAPVFNRAFTATSSGPSSLSAIGITTFQVPPTTDFSVITNRTLSSTNLQLTVYLLDDTVVLHLKVNYIIMAINSAIFHMASTQFYPSKLNTSVGYRSEYSVIYKNTTTYPIYASSTISSVMVLEGFRVLNSAGTYLYLDGVVNFPSSGVINTTFITYQCSLVYYVKYSVLLFDATESDIRSQVVFQLGYASLKVDSSIASSFFSNILPRYQSSSRMFFGMSSFNFTKTVSKEFDMDTTNYASIYSTYNYNNISNLRLTYYFFAERSCSGGDYFYNSWTDPTLDDCLASCSSKTDRPTDDNTYYQCVACHYSCLTCNSNSASDCLTCNSSNFRHMVSPSPNTCNCMTNYVSSGGAMCNLCSAYMTGCLTCSSTSTCSSCIPGYTGSSSCTCSTGSIVSGYCNTVYGCITISDINGTQTCTTCNSTLLVELNSIFKCACITGTTTLSDQSCDPICGDNYVLAVEGCDDGNLINGDGCSSSCTVETNWSCVGVLTQGSTCKINVTVSLNYIGSFRDTIANRADIYFKLAPYFKEYLKVNFSQTISTSFSYQSIESVHGSPQQMLKMTVNYTQNLQNTYRSFQLFLNNTNYFWNTSTISQATLKGINAELTLDQSFWIHNIMIYAAYCLVGSAIVVLITSIFFQKWIGLELIQTYQTIFFLFTLAQGCAYEYTAITEVFKYSNGFNQLSKSEYYKYYTMPDNLLALNIHKEFIDNFNVCFILIFISIVALGIVGLVKRHYKLKLEEVISSQIKKKIDKTDEVLTFIFSRIFLMLVFFSMFKIIFSFVIQLGNDQEVEETYPDQLNVFAGMIAFAFVFSMISFVLYWYLLLPQNYTDEQQFIHLNFQKMTFNYPVVYLVYQALFILTVSIINTQQLTIYIVLGLQIIYFIILIFYRPYNEVKNINKLVHNFTIGFNQCLGIAITGIVIRWNSLARAGSHIYSNSETTAEFFIIFIMALLALGLAVFRLIIFNREVNCKCCKKEEEALSDLAEESALMKKMEKDRFEGYINNVQMVQSKNIPANPSRENSLDLQKQRLKEQLQKKKRKQSDDQMHFNENLLNSFLNQEYANWNKDKSKKPKKPKSRVVVSNVKSTTSAKQAEMKKTSLELYQEMRAKKGDFEATKLENSEDAVQ